MKILNLYAGIGGNRKLWTPNGNEHEITAVEYNPELGKYILDRAMEMPIKFEGSLFGEDLENRKRKSIKNDISIRSQKNNQKDF